LPPSSSTPTLLTATTSTNILQHPTSASLYHLHQHFLTNLTRSHSPFLCPIALSSYHPNPTHDSSSTSRCSAGRSATASAARHAAAAASIRSATPSPMSGPIGLGTSRARGR